MIKEIESYFENTMTEGIKSFFFENHSTKEIKSYFENPTRPSLI